jgi:hypothetical protein
MRAIFEEIKDQYQSTLAELPDLGSDFIATEERKPAISKFGDIYHVTIGHSLGRARHMHGLTSSRLETPETGGGL